MARNPGRYVQVTDGVHKGKKGFMYNKEQTPEFIKLKRAFVHVPEVIQAGLFPDTAEGNWKGVLIQYDFLKVIGFID